ncbi:MAG: hypothetical protein U0930_18940 [Pirellulales bacterium]
MKLRLRLLWAIFILPLTIPVQLLAQSDRSDWDVGRVYIPAESQESLIPNEFWPIELRELNEKLAQHEAQVIQSRVNPLILDRAVYLATINRDLIVSDNSYWKFSGFQTGPQFRVGKVSFALRDAKVSSADQRQLSSVHRFDSDGAIEVDASSMDQPFWFGFQAAPKVEESRRIFDFELPRAKLAVMLVSAESGLQLSSDQVVVEPISSPRSYLGELWPSGLDPRPQPRQSWWVAHIAGVDRFSIEISESSTDRGQVFQHALASTTITHQVTPDSIASSATFQLATESKGAPFQIRLAANQRVRALLVDGKPATWKATSTESANDELSGSVGQHLIQLSNTSLGKSSKIEVQTISRILSMPKSEKTDTSKLPLPIIELVNSITISGNTAVSLDETLEAVEFQSAQQFTPSNANDSSSTSNRWLSQWSRQAAPSILILRNRSERWTANSFVRLDPQATSIVARVNMVLSGNYLRSNELRLPVLAGWNVERVRLPFDVSGKIRTGLVTTDKGEQIVLAWAGKPESFEVYLEVTATQIIEGRPSSFVIENPRIVQSPKSEAPVFFVVNDSNYYRLRSSPTLFPMVIAKRELTSWQQQLLREQDATVFRDLSGAEKKFICDAIATPATLRTAVVAIEKTPQLLEVQTLLNFDTAIIGFDQVRFSLPHGQELKDWTFELLSDGGKAVPLVANQTRVEAGGRIHGQLTLPQTVHGSFTILASTQKPIEQDASQTRLIPLLSTEGCSVIESSLVLQNKLAPLTATTSLNFQPANNCCSAELVEKMRRLFQVNADDGTSWLSAPISISESSYISLYSIPEQASSWVWSQQIHHEILTSGELRHLVELDIQARQGELIELTMPKEWNVVEAFLESEPVEFAIQETTGSIVQTGRIRWPDSQRRLLRFTLKQQVKQLGWLSNLKIDLPRLSIPVLATAETIRIPAGFANLKIATRLNTDPINYESFLPARLWNNLSPEWATAIFGTTTTTWTIYADENQRQILLVDKSSFATTSLILVVLLAMGAWFFIRWTVRGWWIAVLVSIVAIVVLKGNFAYLAQIAILALLVGLMARLIELVMMKPKTTLKKSPLSASRLMALLMIGLFCKVGSSQTTGTSMGDDEEVRRVCGVIIPFETSTENPGEYAYIPKELRDLLASPNHANLYRSLNPRITSANYVMKLRQDPRDPTPAHEFEAEFKLIVPETNGQILLPFDLDVLRPTSLMLNGQPKLLGVRYFEEAEDGGGIIFRPDSVGNVTISLKFQPTIKDGNDRKFNFATEIPAIPNAMLRIVPNSLTTGLNTNASGGLLRSLSGDFVAQLGPIDKLEVQWSEGDRNTTSFISEYVSETWVRGQNDGFSVASQITIDRGRSSQEEFDLIVDSDWEPVGSVWGDAQLVSSSVATALKRRIIRIRLSDSAGPTCSFRMLLAQRQPTRANLIDVPFVSVDRMSPKKDSRVFWWSSDVKSTWTPDGIESLPIRIARDDWAELRLATERTGYQVLVSGIKLKQNLNISTTLTHSESHTLRIFSSHSELELEATWDKPMPTENELAIHLPRQATVKRIESNGKSISSLIGSQGRVSLLPGQLGANATRIKVVAEMPPLQGKITSLPKIDIDNLQPRQANYAIIRGSDLRISFLPTDSGLVFSNVAGRRVNIENLEAFVGEANLPTEMLSDAKLAAPIEVLPAEIKQPRSFTMNIERVGQSFRATVRCSWNTDQSSVDYAIFEIPTSLRDQITVAPFSALFKPHRDESKSTLCIPVPQTSVGSSIRFVEFSFPINSTTASQSLTLPWIASAQGLPDSPITVLPSELDGKAIQWQTNGSPVDDQWFATSGVEKQKQAEYLRLVDGATKLNWQYRDAEKSQASVGLVLVDLTTISSRKVAGIVTYCVTPRNQSSQTFEIPVNCQILGVDCGARQTTWAREPNQIHVALPTNSAPTIVRIMLEWKVESDTDIKIAIANPVEASLPASVHLRMPQAASESSSKAMEDSDGDDRAVVDL